MEKLSSEITRLRRTHHFRKCYPSRMRALSWILRTNWINIAASILQRDLEYCICFKVRATSQCWDHQFPRHTFQRTASLRNTTWEEPEGVQSRLHHRISILRFSRTWMLSDTLGLGFCSHVAFVSYTSLQISFRQLAIKLKLQSKEPISRCCFK